MSFRGELGKMEDSRKFDQDKGDADDRASRFDPSRGRRPPFVGGRGRRPSPPGRDGKPFGDRQREFGGYGRNENDFPPPAGMRDRSPLQGAPDDRYFKKNDRREEAGRKFYEDPPRDRYQSMDGGRGRHEGGYGGSRFDTPVDFKHRPSGGYSAPPPGKDYGDGFPKPNECEIIAMNRQQRLYAESVESRVKGLGILVDVLFLKDEALLTQTIDDIARKGSLYAMVISPQNETHGSVTVNILHGTPQEHRNMPLEDALKLLSRNFHEWVRAQREQVERERSERGPYTGAVAADREMQLLLRMLADGRWVSLAEINSVVLYLTERRDKMRGDERVRPEPPLYKPPPPAPLKDDVDVAQKEQDLQNRIMNIMNQGAPVGGDVPPARAAALEPPVVPPPKPDPEAFGGPASKSESATTPTYINFDNPSVQKALDNLMQSGPNLLKSISLTTPAAPSKQPPFAGGRGMPEATPPGRAPMGMDAMPSRPGMGMSSSRDGVPPGMGGMDAMSSRPGMGAVPSRENVPGMGGMDNLSSRPGMGGMPSRPAGGYGGGMGAVRGGYGGAPPDRMGQQRGGNPPQGQDAGMNQQSGGHFSNQNQFNKYQGQQGSFPPFSSGNMPPRPSFGGMGGPRRF